MILIWINKTDVVYFIKKLNDIHEYKSNKCNCSTFPPKDIENYLQLLISYDEYVQLKDKGVI